MENQGPRAPRHSGAISPLTAARARILEHLQRSPGAHTADAIAHSFGLHVNTARGHLEFLTDQGLALRSTHPGPGRGRPSARFSANPERAEADPRLRDYQALAGALAEHIARTSANPEADAYTAGLAWGRRAAEGRVADSSTAARRVVVALLDELGFAPESNASATRVRLTACPLLDVARAYPEVVCAVHHGLISGALEGLGGSSAKARLEPFAEAGACRVHL